MTRVADRDMLKLTQQEFEGVPLLVKVEVLLASIICMWGKQAALLLLCVSSSGALLSKTLCTV